MREEMIRIENIVKADKDLTILSNFYLNIYKGEVLGLFSLNDLGKAALVEILCGKVKADAGRIYFDETLFDPAEYCAAGENKVFVIDGNNRLSANLTVADNIFVIRSGRTSYLIDKAALFQRTTSLFALFDLSVSPEKLARDLTRFEQCAVELAKAVALGAKLILLDGLSSCMSTLDLWCFTKLIEKARETGVSFLYMDSEPAVLFSVAERIMIMRDGKQVRVFRKDAFREKHILSALMGEEFEAGYSRVSPIKEQEMLRLERLTSDCLFDFSVTVRQGEIVGFLDSDDRGNMDLARFLTGVSRGFTGRIFVDGAPFRARNEADALRKGIGLVCENPIERTLFKEWSIVENLCFMMSHKIKWLWAKPRIKKSVAMEYAAKFGEAMAEETLFNVDTATLFQLVYYRWHLYAPKILICVKPFTGLDVYLRRLLQELMEALTKKGVTVLICSSNSTEAYALADRVILLGNPTHS